jgi:hypothetical protein
MLAAPTRGFFISLIGILSPWRWLGAAQAPTCRTITHLAMSTRGRSWRARLPTSNWWTSRMLSGTLRLPG